MKMLAAGEMRGEEKRVQVDVRAWLDGKTYVLDGVEGVFRYEVSRATYPYPRTVVRLDHRPTAKGRESAAYREMRKRLGDDWSTDLTDSPERYCEIAAELGLYGAIREAFVAAAGVR